MTATEKLRAMLDERGVEWCDHGYENHVWWGDWHAENRHSVNGLYVKVEAVITPEQAIAATVGAGTCEWCKDGKTFDGQTVMMSNHGWQEIRHCPNCGRRLLK